MTKHYKSFIYLLTYLLTYLSCTNKYQWQTIRLHARILPVWAPCALLSRFWRLSRGWENGKCISQTFPLSVVWPSAVQLYNLDLHAAVVVTSSRSSRSAGQQPLNDWNALEIERCVQSRRYIDVNIGAAGGTASREAVTQRRVYCARSSYHSLNPNILAQHKSIAASTY